MMLVVAAAAFLIFVVLQSGQQSQGMGKPAVFGALSLRTIYYTTFVYNSFLFIKQGHNYATESMAARNDGDDCMSQGRGTSAGIFNTFPV